MESGKKLVFEVAWEVVNKVGGIHTVIRTKACETVNELGESYFMIGPYNPKDASTEIQTHDFKNFQIDDSLQCMRIGGIKAYCGKWMIAGSPNVILFDIASGYSNIEGWRHELHERNGISLPVFDKELSDALVFGGLVAWFISEVRKRSQPDCIILAHFHEWISSIALIFIKARNLDVGLLFTTHATLLGRHLSAGGCDLYNSLGKFNNDEESGKRGIYSNYCIERAACHSAHTFTTVSHITAEEAESFLGRYPDVITPNGLLVPRYVALHEFQNLHVVSKNIINEFVRGHFFGHYYFDLDKTVYLFNAGRYEFANKGADILLESAARLNALLKAKNIDVTVVIFLIFQGRTNNFNIESLKNQAMVRHLRQTVEEIQKKVGQRIFDDVVVGKLPNPNELLETKDVIELKKFIHTRFSGGLLPPVVTHNMIDDANDPILCNLRRLGLFNAPEDKIKIVFHPQFLTSTNPLFPIDYENFVRGCHLGVFPSYYEPWGYTPAECTTLGIPSLTTNLSGFGQFMEERIQSPSDYGIYIVDRRHRNVDETINQMTHFLLHFVKQSRRERIMQRNRCERLCELLDWKRLNKFYIKARLMTVEKTHPDKLRYFKQADPDCFAIQKIGRSLSMASTSSEISSDDETPHLWGDCKDGKFKEFENL